MLRVGTPQFDAGFSAGPSTQESQEGFDRVSDVGCGRDPAVLDGNNLKRARTRLSGDRAGMGPVSVRRGLAGCAKGDYASRRNRSPGRHKRYFLNLL
jgi:hypothetical protein